MLSKLIYPLRAIVFKTKEKLVQRHYVSNQSNTLSSESIKLYNRNRKYGPKPKLCYAPYKSLYLNSDGKVTACCKNSIDYLGHIQNQSLTEIWNNTNVKALQKKIEANDLSNGCAFCMKQIEAKNYSAAEAHYFDYPVESSQYKFPTEITFDVSNICNLKCIMCNGRNSALIRAEREGLPPLENPYNEDFFEDLKSFLPHLKIARFQGGEPFLIPHYTAVMEYLIEHNPKCKIYIQTNGTILNQKVKKIIASPQVNLSVSIDSLNETNFNAIRLNGRLDKVLENFKTFIEVSKNKKQKININACLMNNNWQDIPDMIAFAENHNCSLNILPVETPHYFALNILSDSSLSKMIQSIEKNQSILKTNYSLNLMKEFKDYCKSAMQNQKDLKQAYIKTLNTYDTTQLQKLMEKEIGLNKTNANNNRQILIEINEILEICSTINRKKLLAILFIIICNNSGNSAHSITIEERLVNYKLYLIEFKTRLLNPNYFFESIEA